jgi:hypothetical protein
LAAVRRQFFVVEDGGIEKEADLERLARRVELRESLDHGRQALGREEVQLRSRGDAATVLAGLAPVVGEDEVHACREHVAELPGVPGRIVERHGGFVHRVIGIDAEAARLLAQKRSIEPVEKVRGDEPLVISERLDGGEVGAIG